MRLAIGLMALAFAGSASAQLPADIPLSLIAIEPGEVVFHDARPHRSESSAESASIFAIHFLRQPITSDGKTAVAMMRGWEFSCLEPKVTMLMQAAMSEDGATLQVDSRPRSGPIQPGGVVEDLSILACDHVNPRDHTEKFAGFKAALEFARKKFAGN